MKILTLLSIIVVLTSSLVWAEETVVVEEGEMMEEIVQQTDIPVIDNAVNAVIDDETALSPEEIIQIEESSGETETVSELPILSGSTEPPSSGDTLSQEGAQDMQTTTEDTVPIATTDSVLISDTEQRSVIVDGSQVTIVWK